MSRALRLVLLLILVFLATALSAFGGVPTSTDVTLKSSHSDELTQPFASQHPDEPQAEERNMSDETVLTELYKLYVQSFMRSDVNGIELTSLTISFASSLTVRSSTSHSF